MKPKSTSEIEYYDLVYHAELFAPTDFEAAFNFWNREHKRLQRFQDDNKDFLVCYGDIQSEMTPWYFLRKYFLYENIAAAKMCDEGTNAVTKGIPASTLLTLGRYIPYVEKKWQFYSFTPHVTLEIIVKDCISPALFIRKLQ